MAPSVKAVSTVRNNGGGGASLVFIRATDGLSGVADGDLLVAHIVAASSGVGLAISAPAGWTQIGTQSSADGGTAVTQAVFRKAATSMEPATYTFTQNGGGSNESLIGVVVVVEDHNPSAPIHATSTANTATSGSSTFTPNSCTTTVADCLVLTFVGLADINNPGSVTVTNADAETHDAGVDPGFGVGAYGTRVVKATAGTPTAQVFTLSGGTGVDSRAGFQIAVAPQAELSISGVGALSMSGVGHGFGELSLEASGDIEMLAAWTGSGALSLAGAATLAIEGRPQDLPNVLTLSAGTALPMEGQQVGGFTTILTPQPAKMTFNGYAEVEIGTEEDEEPPEIDPEAEGGEVEVPDSRLHITRVIREAPDVTPYLNAVGVPNIEDWTAAFPDDVPIDWGQLRVNVGGKWVTQYRGIPCEVMNWSHAEPFAYKTAVIRFPQITPFEPLPSWLRRDGSSNVKIVQQTPAGVHDTLFMGIVTSVEDEGSGVAAHCIGALYQLDDWKKRPRMSQGPLRDIGDLIASAVSPNARDQRAFRVQSINKVTTGIKLYERGSWEHMLTGYVAGLLQLAWTHDGDHWTVMMDDDIRRAVARKKNRTTEHYSVHVGEQGVQVNLKYDLSMGTTTLFGEGISADQCKWYGAKYPGVRIGEAPVFSGTLIHPDDIHSDFGLFSQEMFDRGWTGFDPGGLHYGLHEEVWVREFQVSAGLQEDGIVGPQTWAAAFGVGADNSRLEGAWIAPLYSLSYTERHLYDPSGGITGDNPAFNARRRRIERHINYDSPISKTEGTRSAKQEVLRDQDLGLFGTIVLTADPPESSRFELRAGNNIRVRNYRGGNPLLHITEVQVDWSSQSVTLTVDEKARDWMTVAAMLKRDRDTARAGRRKETTRQNRSRTISDDKPVWDCEAGAGRVPAFALYGGLWSVVRIPAGRLGDVVRSYFRVENPTQFSVGIFDVPKTPADMLLGDRTGPYAEFVGNPLFYRNYWEQFGEDLLIHWGDRDNPGGWSPYTGPDDDNEDAQITGTIDDRGSWYFESRNAPWLWVAIWAEPRDSLDNNIAYVQGILQPSNAMV